MIVRFLCQYPLLFPHGLEKQQEGEERISEGEVCVWSRFPFDVSTYVHVRWMYVDSLFVCLSLTCGQQQA